MQELKDRIRNRKVILFVGAGVSSCLGLPTHSQLIAHIAAELGYDPDVFSSYGDHLSLAEYYQIQRGTIGSLRSWMDVEWHHGSIDIAKSRVHRLIVELDFPIIYTTNFDRWIERAFESYPKAYVKIADAPDLQKIQDNVTQIVKFHGDFDNDDSIVLTESSYFRRLDFESPLDIKLRADMLRRSVLFIGYSLSDINMKYLLYRSARLWDASGSTGPRPKFHIFLNTPNPVLEAVLKSRGVETIHSEKEEPAAGLLAFLEGLSS